MRNLLYIFPIMTGLMFGTAGCFVRVLSDEGFDNSTIVFQRMVVAVILLAAGMAILKPSLFKVKLKDIWLMAGGGIAGMLLTNYSFSVSSANMTLSFSTVLLALYPGVVVVFSAVLFKERITVRKILFIGLAILGSVMVSGLLETLGNIEISPKGLIFGIMAPIFAAVYAIFTKLAMDKGYDAVTVSFYCVIFALIAITPFADIRSTAEYVADMPGKHLLFMAFHSIAVILIPYVLYNISFKYFDPSLASILSSLDPVSAMALGLILYDEVPTVLMVCGVGVAIIALAFLCLDDNRSRDIEDKENENA